MAGPSNSPARSVLIRRTQSNNFLFEWNCRETIATGESENFSAWVQSVNIDMIGNTIDLVVLDACDNSVEIYIDKMMYYTKPELRLSKLESDGLMTSSRVFHDPKLIGHIIDGFHAASADGVVHRLQFGFGNTLIEVIDTDDADTQTISVKS